MIGVFQTTEIGTVNSNGWRKEEIAGEQGVLCPQAVPVII
jgi:hypothetical protein